MSLPITLGKSIPTRPAITTLSNATILPFALRPSAEDWLRLHGANFLNGDDRWSLARFQREIIERDWFSPNRLWWAIDASSQQALGTVTLEAVGTAGRIHWLMVDAAVRRQAIASTLLTTLEHAAWEAGVRHLTAETLSTWAPAVAFYRRHGYQ